MTHMLLALVLSVSGHWKGSIEVPNGRMEFEVDIAESGAEVIGTITNTAEKVTLPLQTVVVDGRRLTFQPRSDQRFTAELSADGQSAAGKATLSGYMLPFEMNRTGEASIEPQPVSPAVGKELEGVWKATLAGPEREYHFVLTIANRADGTALAHQISVDEGGLMVYTVVKQTGRMVVIESRGVVTSFTGELSAAGTEISGTWSKGAISLPLTLTRDKVEGVR